MARTTPHMSLILKKKNSQPAFSNLHIKHEKFAFVITTCDGKHTPQICKEYSDIVYHSRQV